MTEAYDVGTVNSCDDADIASWFDTVWNVSITPQMTVVPFIVFYCPLQEVRNMNTMWDDFFYQEFSHLKSLEGFWLNFLLTIYINILYGNLNPSLDFIKNGKA